MKTETQVRREFALYFLDLKEAQERDGASVSKRREWETCIAAWLEEGVVPPEAKDWKCPRSLEAVLKE